MELLDVAHVIAHYDKAFKGAPSSLERELRAPLKEPEVPFEGTPSHPSALVIPFKAEASAGRRAIGDGPACTSQSWGKAI